MIIRDAFDDRFSTTFIMSNGSKITATDLADMILDLWDRTPEDADEFGVKDKDIVSVEVDSNDRKLIFGDVVVRVNPNFALAMHIDTDEGNAVNVGNGDGTKIRIIK